METLYEIPSIITAGTTVAYTRTPPDHPASDGWTLTLYLNGASATATAAGVASGDSHVITLSATVTAALAAGDYRYSEVATKSTLAYEYARGTVTVQATLASATAGAALSANERALALVETAISGRLTSDMESYTIDGRSIAKIPIRDLLRIRGMLKAAIWREQNPDNYLTDISISYPETRS